MIYLYVYTYMIIDIVIIIITLIILLLLSSLLWSLETSRDAAISAPSPPKLRASQRYTILWSYYSILYYTKYTVLYCTVLYYTILYYTIKKPPSLELTRLVRAARGFLPLQHILYYNILSYHIISYIYNDYYDITY